MKYVTALIISVFSVIIATDTLDENISNKIIFRKEKATKYFNLKKSQNYELKLYV